MEEREQNTDRDPTMAMDLQERGHLLKHQFLRHLLLLNFTIFLLTLQSSLFKCFPLPQHALGVLLHEHFYVPPQQQNTER